MTIFSTFRGRSAPDAAGQPESADAPRADSSDGALPFPGYDRLDDMQVVRGLSDHSQVELEAVEDYERSHQNRVPVLDKLRFMRQPEPLPGYDALSAEEVMTALEKADLATITKVRGYEQKFAARHGVLEPVAVLHRERRAARAPSTVPRYQSMSASAMENAK